MENRVNRPKVFLSHAWENKPFINRIAADLRRCWIDYWLDKEEIRDGRSWLKMIFEDGIPACDAVIVYLTKESLTSKMVEKELDAAVVRQLSEGGVTLLPYVSESNLRGHLRVDIQSLQCREWNDSNYELVLPTVIAEIWRSYLERTVETAVLQEKNRRLEQQLENERLREQYQSSVFSAREEQEFQYLYSQLSKKIEVTFGLFEKKNVGEKQFKVGEEVYHISVLRILLGVIQNGGMYFDSNYFGFYVSQTLGEPLNIQGYHVFRDEFGGTIDTNVAARIQTDLITFGLSKLTKIERFEHWETAYEVADKMYRFKYWIEYKNLLPNEPLDRAVRLIPEKPEVGTAEQTDKERATAQALAADKKISEARRRRTWRVSGEGTVAASKDIQAVYDDLKERVRTSKEVLEHIKLDVCSDLNDCSITSGDLDLSLKWRCPSKSTSDCVLTVLITAVNHREESESPQQVFSCEFGVKVDNALQVLWYRKDSHGDVYSLRKLTDFCWSTFLASIQRNEEDSLR